MIPYGSKKRIKKLHPHNECEICDEKKPPQKRAERFNARQKIKKEVNSDGSQI